jgi:uncharacterized protein YndB with AHSA1/START domain
MATQNHPAAKAAMLIRKPVHEVYEAMVNPEITSQFWFSKGIGRLDQEKEVEWTWEWYDVKQRASVGAIVPDQSVSFTWGDEKSPTQVDITFTGKGDDTTFISITETGFDADAPDLLERIVGQTEGWTLVTAAMKAYLEQGVRIRVVEDRHPDLVVSNKA